MKRYLFLLASISVGESVSAEEINTENSTVVTEETRISTEDTQVISETQSSMETTTTNETSNVEQPQTAIINGQEVTLEAPEKAGQSEANATQAPKEALMDGSMSRSSRAAVKTIPMYRLFNPNSGEHFYTRDTGERDHLRKIGWNYEGIGWYSYKGANGIPVSRLYNKKVNWHHYTLDENEKRVITKQGWKYEGVGWYAVGNGQQSNDDYKLLGVKNYNQYALGAPSGCEGASLLQALQYKGKLTNWSLTQFLNTIPKSPNGNPNNGFVGSPFV